MLIVNFWGIALVSLSQGNLTHPSDGMSFIQNDLPSIYIECGYALETLYEEDNWYSNIEHAATFIFASENGIDTLPNVGFRLRGNTSRAAAKKSFKISFNTFTQGGSWEGLEKLNLNGEHNDPSVMRARLVWEGMRDAGLPVSRSNHVNLFINGTYHGIYLNLEHIDEEWLEKRFEVHHGNLWKCTYPANLLYNGPEGQDYKFTPSWSDDRVYDLKTNREEDDYDVLARFIDVLNNEPLESLPCALEDIFDVYGYLKIAAAEILCGHWDNYIGNQNNFYLYQRPEDDRIVYIPYDVDNSLGIQWFGEWTSQDPYTWTDSPERPLYTRIISVPEYRIAFTYFMRQLMEDLFTVDWLEARSEVIQSMIQDAVAQDSFYPQDYGFSSNDFNSAISENWGQHVAWGIAPFMESRHYWADIQLDDETATQSPPHTLMAWAQSPTLNDTLVINAWSAFSESATVSDLQAHVETEDTPALPYALSLLESNAFGNRWEVRIPLNGNANASWHVVSEAQGSTIQSPCVSGLVWNQALSIDLVINEVMPLNNSALQDESGGYADWAELFNSGQAPINLGYHHLTNRIDWPNRWSLPNVTLDPGQHIVIYCDNDMEEGPLHAPFHLDSEQGDLFITTLNAGAWRLIDNAHWNNASPNASWGRTTDGAASWAWFFPFTDTPPTPNASNGTFENSISHLIKGEQLWKPTNPHKAGRLIALPALVEWNVYQTNGPLIASGRSSQISGSILQAGSYILQFHSTETNQISSHTLMVQ